MLFLILQHRLFSYTALKFFDFLRKVEADALRLTTLVYKIFLLLMRNLTI